MATVRDPQRFWSKVDVRGPDDCWPWIAKAKTNWGYGVFGLDNKGGTVGAHRMALMLHTGEPIPQGGFVLHSCDNPACCNPAHLSVGTPLDNMRDMYDRGRNRYVAHKGEKNGRALLNWEKVREIRSGGLTAREAQEKFSISRQQFFAVKAGRAWREAA